MKNLPFNYIIRKSSRAKNISIRIKSEGIVELVLPKLIPKFLGENFLNKNINWILKTLEKQKIKNSKNTKNNFEKINILYILIFFAGIFLYFYNFTNINFLEKKEQKVIKIEENNIKNVEKSVYEKFDLESDDSITKFVNNKISFKNKKYIPKNLENVRHIFIYSTKNNSATLRKEAQIALKNLSLEFSKKFSTKLKIISWYRSFEEQKRIYDSWACKDSLCSKPGFSEHQTGLAIDIFEAETPEKFLENPEQKKYFHWFEKNAHIYGFHNTYQKWIKIDWYDIEPWHWRFLWIELASYLKQQNMSFAEFYEESKKK